MHRNSGNGEYVYRLLSTASTSIGGAAPFFKNFIRTARGTFESTPPRLRFFVPAPVVLPRYGGPQPPMSRSTLKC